MISNNLSFEAQWIMCKILKYSSSFICCCYYVQNVYNTCISVRVRHHWLLKVCMNNWGNSHAFKLCIYEEWKNMTKPSAKFYHYYSVVMCVQNYLRVSASSVALIQHKPCQNRACSNAVFKKNCTLTQVSTARSCRSAQLPVSCPNDAFDPAMCFLSH